MGFAILVAAGVAGAVGYIDQVAAFPDKQRFKWDRTSAGTLLLCVLLDAAVAALVALVSRPLLGADLQQAWQGIPVAGFALLGVRSGFQVDESVVGLRRPYEALRKRLQTQVLERSRSITSLERQQLREELTRLRTPIAFVAEVLENHLTDMEDVSADERREWRQAIDAQRNDEGTRDEDRLAVLLNVASQMGGDALLDVLHRGALDRHTPDQS